jgi:hypothetical protein
MTRKILVTSLTALALSLMTSAMVMAQTTTTGTSTSSTTSSTQPSSSNIQGCGNSGMPGCPPKECPPGHGGTNPAGNADCKTQKSGS